MVQNQNAVSPCLYHCHLSLWFCILVVCCEAVRPVGYPSDILASCTVCYSGHAMHACMLKVVCKKFVNIVIIITLLVFSIHYNFTIAGLSHLYTDVWGFVGFFLVILKRGRTSPSCNRPTKQIKIITLAFFVLTQYRLVTDRQTDGRTDGHAAIAITRASIASRSLKT